MAYMKAIAGHSKSVAAVKAYLEKEGRALAADYVNLCERDAQDRDWAEQMDRTRKLYRTDKDINGRATRTYNHWIISPDPQDEIELAQFRQFIGDYLRCIFNDEFQIAVIYHNDNPSGILHAHIIVNNVNLETGGRLAPWLTNDRVHEMSKQLQLMARDRGLHNFILKHQRDEEGLSYHDERSFGGIDISGQEQAKPVKAQSEKPSYYTKTEREIIERMGWSWKEDIRARVRIASNVSFNERDFLFALKALDVAAKTTRYGDYQYTFFTEDGSKRHIVNGKRLGSSFSRRGVLGRLVGEDLRSGVFFGDEGRAKILSAFEPFRVTGMKHIGYKSRTSKTTLTDVATAIEANRKFRIKSFDDYPEAIAKLTDDAASQALLKRAQEVSRELNASYVSQAAAGRTVHMPDASMQYLDSKAISEKLKSLYEKETAKRTPLRKELPSDDRQTAKTPKPPSQQPNLKKDRKR